MPRWPRRSPAIDEHGVGIGFGDLLFALVVARVLEPFADVDGLASAGVVHLVLAGVLVLTSWIGYHTSLNRPQYVIRFPNLPLAQFALDIAMVVVYWLTAVTAEEAGDRASADAEVLLVLATFVLYVCWDVVARRLASGYEHRAESGDEAARRRVTIGCAVAVVALAAVVLPSDLGFRAVVAVDAVLIAVILGFRFLKEYVTGDEGAAAAPAR